MRRTLSSILAVLLGLVFAAALVASFISIPYYVEGPGPTPEVFPLLSVSGHPTYPSQGTFLLTSVSFRPARAIDWVLTKIDSSRSLVPSSAFLGGQTTQEEASRARLDLQESEFAAEYIALRAATGYPKDRGPGALIVSIVHGCPADGPLRAGDVITAIDGRAVDGRKEASATLDAIPTGRQIHLQVQDASGGTESVDLTRAQCTKKGPPLVGFSAIDNFPFHVDVNGDVGGPSGGLAYSLGLYDLLTPGDLTGGRTVAGTGSMDLSGKVYPIGGIGKKIIGAERAGADVFLVPKGNMAEAQKAGSNIPLVPVGTFQDALDYLQRSS